LSKAETLTIGKGIIVPKSKDIIVIVHERESASPLLQQPGRHGFCQIVPPGAKSGVDCSTYSNWVHRNHPLASTQLEAYEVVKGKGDGLDVEHFYLHHSNNIKRQRRSKHIFMDPWKNLRDLFI
jgi:hypothetical protein